MVAKILAIDFALLLTKFMVKILAAINLAQGHSTGPDLWSLKFWL